MENLPNVDRKESLESWTKEEKFKLLQALKEHGSYNIEKISNLFTTKNEDEILTALEFYKKKALIHPTMKQKKVRRLNNLPVIPLASWAKFLMDFYGFEDLQTDTATALRIIADFEDKPPAVCTDKFDFKKIYHMLADALEGKPLLHDKLIMAMFDKCIVETALTSKAFIRSTAYKQILQSINLLEKNINVFAKPTKDNELANLRHLAAQKNYNPLNIPENYLKSSSHSS
ncbi:uncharacterized protein LOC123654643 [Melitaea cinxia]|uniref:uncharacterized protein LOC123654643 n=1 Tax=Melitaea cinxia TaxID=113334 RepID=UPI001E274B60|nr:uncharacterized protein LOC123654643 [Melitaea cinxia]